jgi:hypothetical protein
METKPFILLTGSIDEFESEFVKKYSRFIVPIQNRKGFNLASNKAKSILEKICKDERYDISVIVHAASSQQIDIGTDSLNYLNNDVKATLNITEYCIKNNLPMIFLTHQKLDFIDTNIIENITQFYYSKLASETIALINKQAISIRLANFSKNIENSEEISVITIDKVIQLVYYIALYMYYAISEKNESSAYLNFLKLYKVISFGILQFDKISADVLDDYTFMTAMNHSSYSLDLMNFLNLFLNEKQNIIKHWIIDEEKERHLFE